MATHSVVTMSVCLGMLTFTGCRGPDPVKGDTEDATIGDQDDGDDEDEDVGPDSADTGDTGRPQELVMSFGFQFALDPTTGLPASVTLETSNGPFDLPPSIDLYFAEDGWVGNFEVVSQILLRVLQPRRCDRHPRPRGERPPLGVGVHARRGRRGGHRLLRRRGVRRRPRVLGGHPGHRPPGGGVMAVAVGEAIQDARDWLEPQLTTGGLLPEHIVGGTVRMEPVFGPDADVQGCGAGPGPSTRCSRPSSTPTASSSPRPTPR